MKNAYVAEVFEELSDLVELEGGHPERARAYRLFARSVRGLDEPLCDLASRGALPQLLGVSAGLGARVTELLSTGALTELEALRARVPGSLLELLRVPGLGPSRVRSLWKSLGVRSLGELSQACEQGHVGALEGFDPQSEERTLLAVTFLLEGAGRLSLGQALDASGLITSALLAAGALRADVAGEARRGLEVVTSPVVVASGLPVDRAWDALARHPDVQSLSGRSGHGFFVHPWGLRPVARSGPSPSVRLRVTDPRDHVATLLVETGDAEHVKWLSDRARERGTDLLSLAARPGGEAGVYEALGQPFVPPELREGASPDVPAGLLGEGDLTGVFHVHTDWSDGEGSIVEMARAAARLGYSYVGISDHSRAASYARGLDEARLGEQRAAVQVARREVAGVAILHGCEVDILADGSLDLGDHALASLDFVIASVHSELHMEAGAMTRRILRAVSHPLVTMLGHPTGRLLLTRRGFGFDLRAVAEAAARNDTCLEINANPGRLDLSDRLASRAAASGVRFVINPDAHAPAALGDERLGVRLARRAGLRKTDILNASAAEPLLAQLAARRQRALFALGLSARTA